MEQEQEFKFTPQSNEDSLFWKQKKDDVLTLYFEANKKAEQEGFKIIAFFGLYKDGDIATAKHYVGGHIKDIKDFKTIKKNEFDKAEGEYHKREIETEKENSKVHRRYLI